MIINTKLLSLFFILFLLLKTIKAQEIPAYQNTFRSPVDIPIILSGTFGELRNNHFHSGIDIKTQGVIGKNIYAIDSGYISRIRIGSYGFGKAIYVTHLNGYTSVYAHLSKLSDTIAAYAEQKQYELKSFDIDMTLDSTLLHVKKGDIIALSGNSGSSGGPHLHFEIRDTHTEETINPLLFGYKVKDNIPPRIKAIKIFPASANAEINGNSNAIAYTTSGSWNKYKLKTSAPIQIAGTVAFGIKTYDLLSLANNQNGVYAIELYINDENVYRHDLKRFSFDETRYINALIDYYTYVKSKSRYQTTRILPNNKLSLYSKVENNGEYSFLPDSIYTITYKIYDIAGNISELSFKVKGVAPKQTSKKYHHDKNLNTIYSYTDSNLFVMPDIRLYMPKEALYDSLYFIYSKTESKKQFIASIHHVHNLYTPIHKPCSLYIKPDKPINDSLLKKACIVHKNKYNNWYSIGGEVKGVFLFSTIKYLGDYSIKLDTLPPTVNSINVANNRHYKAGDVLRFKIYDDFSGIKNFNGTINGKWVLFEYEHKKNELFCKITERMPAGKVLLSLEVIDSKENIKTLNYTIQINNQ